jgi:CheY-like chemotaxis protein
VLDRLKHDSATRHIPVHIVSGMEKRQRGLRQGAISYLEKPVSKEALDAAFDSITDFIDEPVKNLLVVEDDDAQRMSIVELVGGGEDDVDITAVGPPRRRSSRSPSAASTAWCSTSGSPDMSGFSLLERIKNDPSLQELPIIIYTGKELSLRGGDAAAALRRDHHRQGREVAGAAARRDRALPAPGGGEAAGAEAAMLERLHSTDATFAGRRS